MKVWSLQLYSHSFNRANSLLLDEVPSSSFGQNVFDHIVFFSFMEFSLLVAIRGRLGGVTRTMGGVL